METKNKITRTRISICEVCGRKIPKRKAVWYLGFIGYNNRLLTCQECSKSLDAQLIQLIIERRMEEDKENG